MFGIFVPQPDILSEIKTISQKDENPVKKEAVNDINEDNAFWSIYHLN